MKFCKEKIFKVYDAETQSTKASSYWDQKMEAAYFNQPKFFIGTLLNSTIFAFLHQFLPEKGLIFDGGCGSNYLAKIFDTASRKIVGLDFALNNLKEGKILFPEALSVGGDLNELPFKEGAFDAAISVSSAEHLESGPLLLFKETHRVLKKGGKFLLLIPTYNREDLWSYQLKKLTAWHPQKLQEIPHFNSRKIFKIVGCPVEENRNGFFAYWFSPKMISRMLREVGFQTKKSFPLDVVGGLNRSRLFGNLGKFWLRRFPLATKRLPENNLTAMERFLLREDIYESRIAFFIHNLIGHFYRYLYAFICEK